MQSIAQGRRRLPYPFLILAVLLSPALVNAKAVLLTQEGIALYDTVALGITKRLGDKVEVETIEKYAAPADLKADLLQRKPELLIVVGVAPARLVMKAELALPMVFCLVPQNERDTLASVEATGVSLEVPMSSQLAAVKTVLPVLKRLAVFFNPKVSGILIQQAREAAVREGFTLVEQPVAGPDELATAFKALVGKIDAVWMLQDRTVGTALGFKVLLLGTLESKLPLIAYSGNFVEGGALLSMAPNFDKTAEAVVGLAKKVMSGTNARSLPWQDGPGELVLNLKVASRLGINIPPNATEGARIFR